MRAIATFLVLAGGLVLLVEQANANPMTAYTTTSVVQQPVVDSDGVVAGRCRRGCMHLPHLRCGCFGGHGGGCGDDNCACHGSYKYPVPSQYTYFWPGIYSQETMTQYVSPYRYPALKPVPEHWKTDPTEDHSPYSGYRY